jgi:hypothetical protein
MKANNETVQLDDGWSVRKTGDWWAVCSPDGYSVRTPKFATKEGAVKGYPRERRLYEWETGALKRLGG